MTRIITRKDGSVWVERFTPIRRAEHILVLATFVVLIVTGLPQKFEGPNANGILAALGGLDKTRWIHRAAGIVFSIHATLHIGVFVAGLLRGTMRWSLLPTVQDLRDALGNLRYYLGLQKEAPELPKFDYRQKFEYLGMVLGGLVMVVTGLVLLYPAALAAWIPGALIPAAFVAHSNEAMLALLVLIVWHVYGSHLSPEVFPMDTSVFTGFLRKDELRERHTKEFRRLFPQEPVHPSPAAPEAAPTEPAK